ncbi:hypothetical protein [Paenibacillus polymyxa]|uniref:hypothetical protein n=1 Tax=Paenibacillus polymyxa TaxID=1406 RepID=UPI002379FCDE|nr:hypothetical protein [Paenibacillus polymyxa]
MQVLRKICTDYIHITEWGTYITTPEISLDEAKVTARLQVINHHAHARRRSIVTIQRWIVIVPLLA